MQMNPQEKTAPAQRWVFTLNGQGATPEEQKEYCLQATPDLEKFARDHCTWYICEIERGDQEGRWHLQGAFYLKTKKRRDTLKNAMGRRDVHLEVMSRNATIEDNEAYCSKYHDEHPDEYFFQYGKAPNQGPGQRNDIREFLNEYGNYHDALIADPTTMCKARNVAIDFYMFKNAYNHDQRNIQVYWLYGPTGSGKTVAAKLTMEQLLKTNGKDEGDYYFKTGTAKWWPGYIGHTGVIWDEFRYSCVANEGGLAGLLKILDRDVINVEYKGGNVRLVAPYFIITSPYDPIDCFTYRNHDSGQDRADDNVDQLVRRIHKCYQILNVGGTFESFDKTATVRQQCGLPAVADPDNGYFNTIKPLEL